MNPNEDELREWRNFKKNKPTAVFADFLAGFRIAHNRAYSRNTDRLVGKHISRLFGLKCMPDLMASGIYPNAKEITESMAAHWAVEIHLADQVDLTDPDVTLVAVGDGSTPRTAAMFALRSAWFCYAVDPLMKPGPYFGDRNIEIRRLHPVNARIEDCSVRAHGPLVIVAVHSHAPMDLTLSSLWSDVARHVVAMPCCQNIDVPGRKPDVEYADPHCWSAKRTVRIWKDV